MGLRDRKKLESHRVSREAASRVFEAQGYDSTTIEQVATFFHYFPDRGDRGLLPRPRRPWSSTRIPRPVGAGRRSWTNGLGTNRSETRSP
jgi:hypothetical protein